jgi:hypothetical protein
LQLPYSQVICELDSLNNYNEKLWALSKIYSYSKQEEPFLHVDSDVFIWQPFNEKLLANGLVAQNLEVSTIYYESVMRILEKNLKYFPLEIIEERENNALIYAFNAGILGGSDIGFFKDYTKKALEFVNKNLDSLSKINVGTFNIFFEQYLFYCLSKKYSKKVGVMINDLVGDNEYVGFDDFSEVPYGKKYLHLLGTYKGHKGVCDQMAKRLRRDYPEYYYRIIALYRDKKIPVLKDYYYYTNKTCEKSLISRYIRIKNAYNTGKNVDRDNEVKARSPVNKFNAGMIKDFVETNQNFFNANGEFKQIKRQIKDAISFESKLTRVLATKKYAYSPEYLYGRDINCGDFHQYVFENRKEMYEKKLVADKLTSIIRSKFDWSEIDTDSFNLTLLMNILKCEPNNNYTAVIAEADKTGFSLSNIDALDIFLLKILKKPKKIVELLEKAKAAFDPEELLNAESEFDSLIIGRVKVGLKSKTIKAIIENQSCEKTITDRR